MFNYRVIASFFFFFLNDCSSFVTDFLVYLTPLQSILHSSAFSGHVAPKSKVLPQYSQALRSSLVTSLAFYHFPKHITYVLTIPKHGFSLRCPRLCHTIPFYPESPTHIPHLGHLIKYNVLFKPHFQHSSRGLNIYFRQAGTPYFFPKSNQEPRPNSLS